MIVAESNPRVQIAKSKAGLLEFGDFLHEHHKGLVDLDQALRDW